MRHHGFDYFTQPDITVLPTKMALPYVIPTVAKAKREGFGAQDLVDPNGSYLSRLPMTSQAQYAVTLFGRASPTAQVTVPIPQGGVVGHSTGGCEASADRGLYGSFKEWFRLFTILENYDALVHSQVVDSSRFRQHLLAWQGCVRTNGFTWTTPADAISHYSHKPNRVSIPEVRAAVTAASCSARAQLTLVASHLFASYISQLPHTYQEDVSAYQQMEDKALPKARAIISK